MSLATIVKGNTFSLAIPLQVYAVEDGEVVLRDYTPESGDNITIRLKGDRRNYTYIPSTNGSTAFIHLEGSEVVGVYAVEVEIVKDDDSKLSSMRFEQLSIVESIDELNEGQITEGIEQGAIYLDPEIFIAGKDGRGIVSIVKTATSGLVDTYTITYTDNTTSTFNVTNGKDGINGQDGVDGADGVGIASIAKTGTQGLVDTYTITMTNGTTYTYQVTNGKDGENGRDGTNGQDGTDGVGIVSITKTSTSGLVDTYTILLTNGTTTTFTVTNGSDATQVQSDWAQNDSTAVDFIKNKPTNVSAFNNDAGYLNNNFCPIIEDTRDSKVATITGNAPFATLASGQIILLHLAYGTTNSTKLKLTLSGGTDTDAINIMYSNLQAYTVLSQIGGLNTTAGMYLHLIYNGINWIAIGFGDGNTQYATITNALISAGTDTNAKTVSAKVLRDNFYIKSEVNNLCPIIEDTRSSAVAAITGVAPFSTLVDGQRILLHLKYKNAYNPTLTLTLSGGTDTNAIPIKSVNFSNIQTISANWLQDGAFYDLIYDQTNTRWLTMVDKDTVYPNMPQSVIDAGTDTYPRMPNAKLIHDNAYIVEESYSSGNLKANKMYDFGTVSSALTIPSLDATNDLVSNALNFYALRFIAGADNLNITFPTGVIVDDEPTINTGDYVEIMINLYVVNGVNNFYASIKTWQAQ